VEFTRKQDMNKLVWWIRRLGSFVSHLKALMVSGSLQSSKKPLQLSELRLEKKEL